MFTHVRSAAAGLLVLALVACDTGSPSEPERLPPLQTGVWRLHRVAGQSMPALVAQETVESRVHRTYVDSATLAITPDGRWSQSVFLESWADNDHVDAVAIVDVGSWAATDSGYVFVSDQHGLRHVLRTPAHDSLEVRMLVEGVTDLMATLRRQPAPPLVTAAWQATHVLGMPVPSAMYLFDPDIVNGKLVSVHWIVDSAELAIYPTGRYRHRIQVTQWIGEPGGPPLHPTARFYHGDFGEWHRNGTSVTFVSHWLQNHTMTGSFGTDGVLRMQHGFGHGDMPVAVQYGR